MKKHLIKEVVENSIADQLEITSGDYLLSIDGQEIKDIFDYHLLSESSELTIEKKMRIKTWDSFLKMICLMSIKHVPISVSFVLLTRCRQA